MTAIRILTVGVALAAATFAGAADEKKGDKDAADMLVGSWKVTDGKKAGAAMGDDAKKGTYVITKDTIKIMVDGMDKPLFVFKYTLDTKATPVAIDMEITDGPGADTKGAKAKGIVEATGDEFKIAYDPHGGDRPTKFDGEKFYFFTLKKEKGEKKDK